MIGRQSLAVRFWRGVWFPCFVPQFTGPRRFLSRPFWLECSSAPSSLIYLTAVSTDVRFDQAGVMSFEGCSGRVNLRLRAYKRLQKRRINALSYVAFGHLTTILTLESGQPCLVSCEWTFKLLYRLYG